MDSDDVIAEFQPVLGDSLFLIEIRQNGEWKAPAGMPWTYSLGRALAVAEYIATPAMPSRVVRVEPTSFTFSVADSGATEADGAPKDEAP
jgi:hypothetical protein